MGCSVRSGVFTEVWGVHCTRAWPSVPWFWSKNKGDLYLPPIHKINYIVVLPVNR